MSDYKQFFENMKKYHPKLENFESCETDFWEELYQAFKERLVAQEFKNE